MSQRQVVDALNWRWHKKLSRIENDESVPSLMDAAALADFYGISLDWLTGQAPNPSGLVPGTVITTRLIAQVLLDPEESNLPKDPRSFRPRPFVIPPNPVLLGHESAAQLMNDAEPEAESDIEADGTQAG